jgi:hypothetical protein
MPFASAVGVVGKRRGARRIRTVGLRRYIGRAGLRLEAHAPAGRLDTRREVASKSGAFRERPRCMAPKVIGGDYPGALPGIVSLCQLTQMHSPKVICCLTCDEAENVRRGAVQTTLKRITHFCAAERALEIGVRPVYRGFRVTLRQDGPGWTHAQTETHQLENRMG